MREVDRASDRRYRPRSEARPESRRPDPPELEQPNDPRAMAAPRLEQLQHPAVIAADLTGQAERDDVRQVEVADADGIGVDACPEHHLGRGPRPDPGDRPQPSI